MKHFDYLRMWLYLSVFSIAFLGVCMCPHGIGSEIEAAYILVLVGTWVAIREMEDPEYAI